MVRGKCQTNQVFVPNHLLDLGQKLSFRPTHRLIRTRMNQVALAIQDNDLPHVGCVTHDLPQRGRRASLLRHLIRTVGAVSRQSTFARCGSPPPVVPSSSSRYCSCTRSDSARATRQPSQPNVASGSTARRINKRSDFFDTRSVPCAMQNWLLRGPISGGRGNHGRATLPPSRLPALIACGSAGASPSRLLSPSRKCLAIPFAFVPPA